MLGNSSQQPEFGHFTLECALNSSFHWFIRESWARKRRSLLTLQPAGPLPTQAPDPAPSPGLQGRQAAGAPPAQDRSEIQATPSSYGLLGQLSKPHGRGPLGPRPHHEALRHGATLCRRWGGRGAGRTAERGGSQHEPHPAFAELTGMSRRAWFSAFGRPFFFPSVLSLVGLPGSKHSGAWLDTVCPPRATGIPATHYVPRSGSCASHSLACHPRGWSGLE